VSETASGWIIPNDPISDNSFTEAEETLSLLPSILSLLSEEQRENIPDRKYALPEVRKFPIDNCNNVESTLQMFSTAHLSDTEKEEAISEILASAKSCGIDTNCSDYDSFKVAAMANGITEEELSLSEGEELHLLSMKGGISATLKLPSVLIVRGTSLVEGRYTGLVGGEVEIPGDVILASAASSVGEPIKLFHKNETYEKNPGETVGFNLAAYPDAKRRSFDWLGFIPRRRAIDEIKNGLKGNSIEALIKSRLAKSPTDGKMVKTAVWMKITGIALTRYNACSEAELKKIQELKLAESNSGSGSCPNTNTEVTNLTEDNEKDKGTETEPESQSVDIAQLTEGLRESLAEDITKAAEGAVATMFAKIAGLEEEPEEVPKPSKALIDLADAVKTLTAELETFKKDRQDGKANEITVMLSHIKEHAKAFDPKTIGITDETPVELKKLLLSTYINGINAGGEIQREVIDEPTVTALSKDEKKAEDEAFEAEYGISLSKFLGTETKEGDAN